MSHVNNDVAITTSMDSHQHASGQCADFETEFCHNSHSIYIFIKDVSIVALDLPDFYNSAELDQYYFSFKSTLLRPPIA